MIGKDEVFARYEFARKIFKECAAIADAHASCEGIARQIRDEILEAFGSE